MFNSSNFIGPKSIEPRFYERKMKQTLTPLAMQDELFAPNSCKTCRQRRVRCDRLLPKCHRCASLLLPCAGYERTEKIVWTNSMASRGKMMGKATFDTITDNAHDHKDISDIELCTNFPVAGSPLVDPSLQNIPRSYHDYIRYCESHLRAFSFSHSPTILQFIKSSPRSVSYTTTRPSTLFSLLCF
jgi:hypothetical protein